MNKLLSLYPIFGPVWSAIIVVLIGMNLVALATVIACTRPRGTFGLVVKVFTFSICMLINLLPLIGVGWIWGCTVYPWARGLNIDVLWVSCILVGAFAVTVILMMSLYRIPYALVRTIRKDPLKE